MAKLRGTDPDWQREEYARQMGHDALQRQRLARATDARKLVCDCQQKYGKNGETPNAWHKVSCPLYRPGNA